MCLVAFMLNLFQMNFFEEMQIVLFYKTIAKRLNKNN